MTKHHANDGGDPVPKIKKTRAKTTSHLDKLIGKQLSALRKRRGESQTAFGKLYGVSYQQHQKNEKGENRVYAISLLILSAETGQPVEYFFRTARKELLKQKESTTNAGISP